MSGPLLTGRRTAATAIRAVVIGTSAGGIEALLSLLGGLGSAYQLPIIVVQHMPETAGNRLVEVFQACLAMPVKEAEDKESIMLNTLYFAAPGYHLSIEQDLSFSLSREEPLRYSRPSIDILFESAADAYGARLAGILLTGANEDGARGLQGVAQAGGLTVVQSPAEAQVATMPEAAIRLFRPDHILPLRDICRLLIELDGVKC